MSSPQFNHVLHVCVTGIVQPHDCLCASEVIWNDMVNIKQTHYSDVTMGALASQITSLTTVYSIVYSDANQGKHQSSASLAFIWGIHRGPVNSPHKWPVTRNMFPFDDVIMYKKHKDSLTVCMFVGTYGTLCCCGTGMPFVIYELRRYDNWNMYTLQLLACQALGNPFSARDMNSPSFPMTKIKGRFSNPDIDPSNHATPEKNKEHRPIFILVLVMI